MNLEKLQQPNRQKKAISPMRIKLLAACTLSLLSASSFAQKGLDFGIRLGGHASALLNSTDQEAGPELDFAVKPAMAFGVGVGYNFNNHMGVGLDILYSSQGQGYKGNADTSSAVTVNAYTRNIILQAFANNIPVSGNYTAKTTLSCIKIPILFRYGGDNTKKSYFSMFIGPQINILTGVKYTVNDKDAPTTDLELKNVEAYNKTTFDAVLGLGAGFNLSPVLSLTAHLRLDYGLSDIENKNAKIELMGSDNYYANGRAATHNATGGLLIGLNYKLQKAGAKGKPQPAATKKKK
jgi:hypothetical protein